MDAKAALWEVAPIAKSRKGKRANKLTLDGVSFAAISDSATGHPSRPLASNLRLLAQKPGCLTPAPWYQSLELAEDAEKTGRKD